MTHFKQSRNWAFTDFQLLDLENVYRTYKDVIRYMCWGKETCPKTQKVHYQGWIQLVNKKTLGGVKRLMGCNKIHLESCRGSEFQNDVYCKKENDFKTFGKFVCQGARTDLETIKKKIENGETMYSVAKDHFGQFVRYHSGFTKYAGLVAKQKTKLFRQVHVELIQGPTGTGKTRRAVARSKEYFKIQGDQLKWFDGYNGERTLVIDEYANDVKITKLLSLLDGYQLRLPVKGGFTYANWTKVIITTNLRQLHSQANEEHVKALNRRITKVIDLYKDKLPKCEKGNTNPFSLALGLDKN